ncbi:unnamed protein product, partial [Mesorhabditis belari]|uniref:Uncharacterized protein n=1 Tax=Mesorhabditis belari TaxID=2138241 RepID=A0AAF3FKF4_9BILA
MRSPCITWLAIQLALLPYTTKFIRLKRYFVLSRVHYDDRQKREEISLPINPGTERVRARFTKLAEVDRPLVHGVLVSPSPVVWEAQNPSLVPLKQRVYIPGRVPTRIPVDFFSREPSPPKIPTTARVHSMVQIRSRQANIYGISRRRSVVEEGELQTRASTQQPLTVKKRGEGWRNGRVNRGNFMRNKRTQQVKVGYIPVRRLRPVNRREARIGVEKRFHFEDGIEESTPTRCLKCYVFWTQRSNTIPRSSIYNVCCGREEAIP